MFLMVTSGCSSIDEIEIFSKPVERIPLNLDPPPPIKLERVEWIVITEENYKEVFDKLKEQGKDIVLFGLTDDGYETLAINFAQVRKYIILNNNVLQKYKDYYEGSEDAKGAGDEQ